MSRGDAGAALFGAALAGFALFGCGKSTTEKPPATAAADTEANVIVCAPGSFMSGNECLPGKPECPQYMTMRDGQCVLEEPEPAAVAAPEPVTPVASHKGIEALVDSRRGRLAPRGRLLLVTEAQGLEALFQASPKDGADRPNLMRRLSEVYVELSASVKREGETGAGEPDKMAKIETAARAAAIKYYALRVQQYPKWCASVNATDPGKSTGCADEALYYMSLEYRRSGEIDKTRKSLLQLIQNYPRSSFTPHAYFQFGDIFLDESMTDVSKLALAEQSLLEAVKYPTSTILPAALLRLGKVYELKGDAARARSTYKRLLRDFPSSPLKDEVPATMQ